MEHYREIRRQIYSAQFTRWKHILNIKAPYSFIKGIYYIETASLFLFITQKIIKSPNLITILYILSGVLGAFLIILSPHSNFFYLGLFMVFTKGTFDWADGALARRLNKTSFLGHALDVYGASVCDAAFRVAFVFYTLNNYSEYMFLFPLFSFIILITKFNTFTDYLYFKSSEEGHSITNKEKERSNLEKDLRDGRKMKKVIKLYNTYCSFLDGRARSIDFLICVLFLDSISSFDIKLLLLILSLLIILRASVQFFATTFLAFKKYRY